MHAAAAGKLLLQQLLLPPPSLQRTPMQCEACSPLLPLSLGRPPAATGAVGLCGDQLRCCVEPKQAGGAAAAAGAAVGRAVAPVGDSSSFHLASEAPNRVVAAGPGLNTVAAAAVAAAAAAEARKGM